MDKAYTFSDVLIIPQYSEIDSRRNIDISSDFGLFKIDLPIISANMKTITGPKMAIEMANNGGLGILHRFCTVDQAIKDYLEVKKNIKKNKVGVSVGVQEEDKLRFDKLYEAGARIFCIDIANGYCKLMKDIVKWIKNKQLKNIYIIGGNIATGDGAAHLADWGVDTVKAGIGPGSACLTRKNVGVGVPQLYALEQIKKELDLRGFNKTKIISDGGMTTSGDIAKSLKYADAGMLGSMLSGTTETPGSVFTNDKGEFYKVYSGSASGENKTSNGNSNEYVEGISKTVSFRGHVKHILRQIKEGLQSSFSYTNSNNLKEFQNNCKFIEITSGGKTESKI